MRSHHDKKSPRFVFLIGGCRDHRPSRVELREILLTPDIIDYAKFVATTPKVIHLFFCRVISDRGHLTLQDVSVCVLPIWADIHVMPFHSWLSAYAHVSPTDSCLYICMAMPNEFQAPRFLPGKQDKNAATDKKVRQNNTHFSLPRSRLMLVTALGPFFLKKWANSVSSAKKTRWVRFGTQTIGWEERIEFSPGTRWGQKTHWARCLKLYSPKP